MRGSHATNENLDLLYTLDRHDVDEESNDTNRKMMKKYIDGVLNEFLTDRQREIVLLYHGQGKKTPEIAEKIGISPRSVQVALDTAMKKIESHKKIFLKAI